ncbi:MAG: hypothetical protein QOE01_3150, partial [Actinomycetota bacterium]|nr:hypothetical protein [Actinomycetota bacterium]
SRAVRDKYSWDTVLAPWRGWVCGLGK